MTSKLFNLPKTALFVFAISFLLSSCTEEKYIENPAYETEWDVFDLTVKQGDWKRSNNKEYFYSIQDVPELDEDRAKYGGLIVARHFGNSMYRPLEYTDYKFEVTNPSTGEGYYYSETVSYEYRPGAIIFYVATSDLNDGIHPNYKPEEMEFKITIFY